MIYWVMLLFLKEQAKVAVQNDLVDYLVVINKPIYKVNYNDLN